MDILVVLAEMKVLVSGKDRAIANSIEGGVDVCQDPTESPLIHAPDHEVIQILSHIERISVTKRRTGDQSGERPHGFKPSEPRRTFRRMLWLIYLIDPLFVK